MDEEYPYEYLWDEFSFGSQKIKVIGYDKNDNKIIDEVLVKKFL